MKKILTLCMVIVAMLTASFFTACKKEPLVIKDSDTFVIINVETTKTDLTLSEYMSSLQEYKDMFVINNGMVVSINGIKNASNYSSCWMIYTNDYSEDVSNSAWGTVNYKGEVFNSSAYGADSLIVKNGYSYIFVYQTF